MLVSVEGLEQGAIETELSILPRKGETIRVFYGQMPKLKVKLKMFITLLINMMVGTKSL
jgi:hypothetical protein